MKTYTKEDMKKAWDMAMAGALKYDSFEDWLEENYPEEVEDTEGDIHVETS